MTGSGAAFGFRVERRKQDDEAWDGWPSKKAWVARGHTWVEVRFDLPPTTPGYTRDELLAIYRWYAGVTARIGLRLHSILIVRHQDPASDDPDAHRCHHDITGYRCGLWFDEGLADPRACLTACGESYGNRFDEDPPLVVLLVPTRYAETWMQTFEKVIARTLAADSAPLDPIPEPAHPALELSQTTAATEEQRR